VSKYQVNGYKAKAYYCP